MNLHGLRQSKLSRFGVLAGLIALLLVVIVTKAHFGRPSLHIIQYCGHEGPAESWSPTNQPAYHMMYQQHKRYAEKYGYRYNFFTRSDVPHEFLGLYPFYWMKAALTQLYLPQTDMVLYLDHDTLIDPECPIEAFLQQPQFANYSFFIAAENFSITRGLDMNTGVYAVKNDAIGQRVIQTWLDSYSLDWFIRNASTNFWMYTHPATTTPDTVLDQGNFNRAVASLRLELAAHFKIFPFNVLAERRFPNRLRHQLETPSVVTHFMGSAKTRISRLLRFYLDNWQPSDSDNQPDASRCRSFKLAHDRNLLLGCLYDVQCTAEELDS